MDLVVTEVQLRGLTGLEVLEALCAEPEAPPFVVVSSFVDRETRARAFALGAEAVLDTPYGIGALIGALRTARARGSHRSRLQSPESTALDSSFARRYGDRVLRLAGTRSHRGSPCVVHRRRRGHAGAAGPASPQSRFQRNHPR